MQLGSLGTVSKAYRSDRTFGDRSFGPYRFLRCSFNSEHFPEVEAEGVPCPGEHRCNDGAEARDNTMHTSGAHRQLTNRRTRERSRGG